MPDQGFVAVCIRPDCEWIAVELNAAGEETGPRLFTMLGALREVDRHCFEVHGERPRTYCPPVEAEAAVA